MSEDDYWSFGPATMSVNGETVAEIEDIEFERTEPITEDVTCRRDMQVEISMVFETTEHDLQEMGLLPTLKIEGGEWIAGEYRQCAYCETLVEMDHYGTHLEDEHGLKQ